MEELTKLIEDLRKHCRVSRTKGRLKQMSIAISIPSNTIGNYITGKTEPSYSKGHRIRNYLDNYAEEITEKTETYYQMLKRTNQLKTNEKQN